MGPKQMDFKASDLRNCQIMSRPLFCEEVCERGGWMWIDVDVRLNLRTFDKVSPIYRLGVGAFIYEPTPNRVK